MHRICIPKQPEHIAALCSMLQKGLPVHGKVGCSVEAFITGFLDISRPYIDARIPTILLDGKPVEDLGTTVVSDGSLLALSSAMPGLAGATLRRGGHLASLRKTITRTDGDLKNAERSGVVTIKFFNLLIRELGIPLLEKGIPMDGAFLWTFLEDLAKDAPSGDFGLFIDGKETSFASLCKNKAKDMKKNEPWLLRIRICR